MEPAAPSTVETEHDAGAHQAHADEFYAQTNPRVFGLPLGVLIAAGISGIAVCITLLKFVAGSL
jgi:hypothetical protein